MEGEAATVPIVSTSTGDETNNPNAGMSQVECKDRIRESLKRTTPLSISLSLILIDRCLKHILDAVILTNKLYALVFFLI